MLKLKKILYNVFSVSHNYFLNKHLPKYRSLIEGLEYSLSFPDDFHNSPMSKPELRLKCINNEGYKKVKIAVEA